MSIVPALPGCGQPANQFVEIYQPAGTDPWRSLPGAGYACQQHLVDLVAVIARAGLTPLHIPAGPLGAWPCDESYEFETAGQPDRPQLTHQIPIPGIPPVEVLLAGAVPVEPEHTAWCVRAAICRMEKIHCSAPYPATPLGAAVDVRVWVEQPATAKAVPVVILEVVDEERPVEYRLSTDQARHLADQVCLVVLAGNVD
jgi:hypothetical protein